MLLTEEEIKQIAQNHYYMYGETSFEDVQLAIEEAIKLIESKLCIKFDSCIGENK